MSDSWTLTGPDGSYQSDRPGNLGGHRRSKLYGRLDCSSALQALARGGYARDRVFFLDEHAAQAAGYRPCAVCLPNQYAAWKRSPPILSSQPGLPENDEALTEPELRTVIAQLERLDARLVGVGHGRDRCSRLAADQFAAAWGASSDRNGLERSVAVMVDWAADAASWLKPARRLTEPGVDAWVISDTPRTWAQMGRRLRDSTNWDPGRTVALAALNTPLTIALAGANTLDGLCGATADGRLWFVHDGELTQHTPPNRKR